MDCDEELEGLLYITMICEYDFTLSFVTLKAVLTLKHQYVSQMCRALFPSSIHLFIHYSYILFSGIVWVLSSPT